MRECAISQIYSKHLNKMLMLIDSSSHLECKNFNYFSQIKGAKCFQNSPGNLGQPLQLPTKLPLVLLTCKPVVQLYVKHPVIHKLFVLQTRWLLAVTDAASCDFFVRQVEGGGKGWGVKGHYTLCYTQRM
jgi:hypothetical protein